MQFTTTYLSAFDQTKLFVRDYQPDNSPKAFIVLVHGIGEHSGRYEDWIRRFIAQDVTVVTFDQRGHGNSEGKRGVIKSYSDFMKDIDTVIQYAESRHPQIPMFLYGHSMGGGEVLNHLLRRKANYCGVISTSPWIKTQAAPPKIAIPFIRLLNRLIPFYRTVSKFDSVYLSHDKSLVERYQTDDLVHDFVSIRMFIEAYDAGYFAYHSKNAFQKPLLLLHGTGDKITNCDASKYFAQNNSKYTSLKLWEGGYHELHNETFKDDVFEYIISWINKILKDNGSI